MRFNSRSHHNYIAFFITFACNLRCDYCINDHNRNDRISYPHMTTSQWIDAANRLVLRDDLPLTLQGGEPTLYKGFYDIVREVKPEIKMDLMTNMGFDVDEFIKKVPVWRFTREAPYAAIRVSYHPGQNNIDELIKKTVALQDAGFRIGLYGIEHPDVKIREHIYEVKKRCLDLGLDFRTKEFLGLYDGKTYGTFKYKDAVSNPKFHTCLCKTTELLVSPSGHVYRCHSDLYNKRQPIAHILDDTFNEDVLDQFKECYFYGDCNPCDVKVKTNRFQIFGHTSVEIKDIKCRTVIS